MDAGKVVAIRTRERRTQLGLTQEQVAARLGVPRSAVSDIEAGKREVSAAELVALRDLLGLSLEQLLGIVEERSEDAEPMFRAAALAPETSVYLDRWMQRCEEFQRLEAELGDEPASGLRPIQGAITSFEQVDRLADEERDRLKLGLTPAHTLLGVLEDRLRVKVMFADLDDGLSGASLTSPRFGPAILANRRHSPGRRVFTLAHELFHLLVRGPIARVGHARPWHVCDVQPAGARKDRVEQLADRFAGRLLVPPEHFLERLRQVVRTDGAADQMDLIALARYFGVSVQAVFVQLAVHKLAPWNVAMGGYRDPALQESILQAGPESGPEPQRFKRLAVRAYLAERISKGKLAELLDVNIADVDDELDRLGGGGTDRGMRIALPG
jgi:Zn-dependent peptidase ImmA (M78 family)/DNA-binding XRE family transcriptional regulator